MNKNLKRLFGLLAMVAMMFAFINCDSDEDEVIVVEDPKLALSELSIVLDKQGGSKDVEISTNQLKVSGVATSDWLHASVSGSTLSISADVNEATTERTGQVLVVAGALNEVVEVRQSPADIVLELNPTEVTLEDVGGELWLEVLTNYDNVEVTPDVDWLEVSRIAGTPYWRLVVEKNTNTADREGKLTVKAGSSVDEVVVTQLRHELFVLPYLAANTTYSKANYFEDNRNSALVQLPNLITGGFQTTWAYAYAMDNDDWLEVAYEYENGAFENYTYAQILTENLELFADEAAVIDFLERNGFTHKAGSVFEHNELPYELEVIVAESQGLAAFTIEQVVKQEKEYPTWNELPVFPQAKHIYFGSDAGWYFADVEKHEKAIGDNYVFEGDDMPGFAVYRVDASPFRYSRAYWFDQTPADPANFDQLDRVMYVSEDLEKAFYEEGGKYHTTNEFEALMTKNGFRFYADQGTLFYIHDDNMVAGVRTANFSDMFEGNTVISFQVYRDDTSQFSNPFMLPGAKRQMAAAALVEKMEEGFKRFK